VKDKFSAYDGRKARERQAYGCERRSLVVVVVMESSHWSLGSLQMSIIVSSYMLQPIALILYNNFHSKNISMIITSMITGIININSIQVNISIVFTLF
jgi:hypothetical protein